MIVSPQNNCLLYVGFDYQYGITDERIFGHNMGFLIVYPESNADGVGVMLQEVKKFLNRMNFSMFHNISSR